MNTAVSNAYDIALNDLRKCYTDRGILAGRKSKRYNRYWARNAFFASLGALQLKDYEQVKRNLRLFASFQNKRGMIANSISRKMKPRYRLRVGSVIDSTALFVVAMAQYVKEAGDTQFARDNFWALRKAMLFLASKDRNNDFLIEERVFANWAESVLRFGNVLYSNCCYFKALQDFSWICSGLGKRQLAADYSRLAGKTKEKINGMFWQGNYYIDWIDFMRHDIFACDGNLLAIDWGIADKEQSQMILNKIKQHQMNKVPVRTNHPLYPFWRIPPMLLPLMEFHYHNGNSWPWLGCLNAMGLHKVGWRNDAKKELKKVAALINEYGTVHEVFGSNGKPVKGLFLQSEHPFSWNAGMFIRAFHQIAKKDRQSGF